MADRILVVDDQRVNAEMVSGLLRKLGYDVEIALTGNAALGIVHSRGADLVVSDIVMPGMDGYELCRRLRANNATALLPVILVTSAEGQTERLKGIEAGADTMLPDLVDGRLEEITAATVYEAAVLGDLYANEVMKETVKFLGAGVANLINVLNPEMIVIAGGVTRAGEHLFGPLRAEVRRRAFRSSEEACQIVPAQLQGTAGVIGAAGVFRTEVLGL